MKKVLVTGSTGFLGGAVAAHLLSSTDVEVVALVRARTAAEAEARFGASVARFGVPDVDLRRVHVVAGDLGASLASPALAGVTHVLNAAAQTSFAARDDVRATNVDATVAFAQRARRLPRLERFVHVGTAWICGMAPTTSGPVAEDASPSPAALHAVRYTQTKAEGEMRLAALSDFPLVVARPSIIAGHTRLGCGPSASIFWAFLAMNALRRITWSLDTCIDVVPVDWAAASLVHLLAKPALAHSRYHVSAGAEGSATFDVVARAFGARYAIDREPILRWPDERFRVLEPFGGARRFRRALSLYYRFAQANVVFDDTRLRGEGAARAPSFDTWIDVCVASTRGRALDALAADDHLPGSPTKHRPCRTNARENRRNGIRRTSIHVRFPLAAA